MASITTDKSGNRAVQFVAGDGKRRTIRLGRTAMKQANEIRLKVEAMHAAKVSGLPLDGETAAWVARLGDNLAKKLARAGLIAERTAANVPYVGDFATIFLDSKPHIKQTTRRTFQVALDRITDAMGPKKRLTDIDEETMLAAIAKLKADGYAPAFIAKLVTVGKAMFRCAVRRGLLDKNPLEYIAAGSQVNKARNQFIPAATVHKLLGALPDAEWRLAVALARWGGLRIPSELFSLQPAHVLWDQNKLIVPTPKLEHLPGRDVRIIPLFAEIKPFLEEAWEALPPGSDYLTPRLRTMSGNLSTQLRKYIRRAGLEEWPRLWQNLRASRATELADAFPSHVAAAWLGHTSEIADRHYRSLTEEHFQRAIEMPVSMPCSALQNAVQSGAEPACQRATAERAGIEEVDRSQSLAPKVNRCQDLRLGATGFEPVTSTV